MGWRLYSIASLVLVVMAPVLGAAQQSEVATDQRKTVNAGSLICRESFYLRPTAGNTQFCKTIDKHEEVEILGVWGTSTLPTAKVRRPDGTEGWVLQSALRTVGLTQQQAEEERARKRAEAERDRLTIKDRQDCGQWSADGVIATGQFQGPALGTIYRNAACNRLRATANEALKNTDQALLDLNEAIRLDPQNIAGYIARAQFNARQGKPDLAIADFDLAVRLEPGNASAYDARATFRMSRDDHRAAIDDLNQVIALDGKRRNEILETRASIFRDLEDWDRAIADYDVIRPRRSGPT
jgi:hypothetical protein